MQRWQIVHRLRSRYQKRIWQESFLVRKGGCSAWINHIIISISDISNRKKMLYYPSTNTRVQSNFLHRRRNGSTRLSPPRCHRPCRLIISGPISNIPPIISRANRSPLGHLCSSSTTWPSPPSNSNQTWKQGISFTRERRKADRPKPCLDLARVSISFRCWDHSESADRIASLKKAGEVSPRLYGSGTASIAACLLR